MQAADIHSAREKLEVLYKEYLTHNDWKLKKGFSRWYKDFKWGSASTRRIEADLVDAVNHQIKVEEAQ